MYRVNGSPPASVLNDAVDRALDTIGEDKKRFAYWCGRLRGINPQLISLMAAKAKDGRNPAALFNWLLREHRAQQRIIGTTDNHVHTTPQPTAQYVQTRTLSAAVLTATIQSMADHTKLAPKSTATSIVITQPRTYKKMTLSELAEMAARARIEYTQHVCLRCIAFTR